MQLMLFGFNLYAMVGAAWTINGMSPLKVDSQQRRVPALTFAHTGDGFFVMSAAGGAVLNIGMRPRR